MTMLFLWMGFFASPVLAQRAHLHQHELFYLSEASSEEDYDAAYKPAGPSPRRHTNKHFMRRTVYGFHPGWNGTTWESYDYGLLPIVAYYGYIVDPSTGAPKTTYFWETTRMITHAHKKGAAVELVVASGTQAGNRKLLGNPRAVSELVENVCLLLEKRDGDGVCLDFEDLPANRRSQFTGLVRELREELKIRSPKAGITLCLPGNDPKGAFDIDSLQQWVDLFVVKPYDLTGEWGPGPVAPLRSGSYWKKGSCDGAISFWLGKGIPREKLLLSIPNYSWQWEPRPSTAPYPKAYGSPDFVTYADLKRNYNYPATWDSLALENIYSYATEGHSYEVHASDEKSIQARIDYVNDRNLAGAAIWALGYDHGFDGIWNAVKSTWSQSVKDEVSDLAVEERNDLLLGPDNGETIERNRNNWIPMLIGCLFLIALLFVLKRFL